MTATAILADSRRVHPLHLVMLAADEVRLHLCEYADVTDCPAWEAVQAADLLDTVADLLGKAAER